MPLSVEAINNLANFFKVLAEVEAEQNKQTTLAQVSLDVKRGELKEKVPA